jgi:hypothetical protein
MINKKYLEQAVRIKKDFLELSGELERVTEELEKNKVGVENVLKGLIDIKDRTDQYKSDDQYREDIMDMLKDFELEAKKLEDIYTPVNDRLEKLKEEENSLYESLKKEYPKLKESQLIKEIRDYVKEKV